MPNLLLDTHVLLWCLFRPEVLKPSVEREILSALRVFVPASSLYECVRALSANRVKDAPEEAADAIPGLIEASGFELLHPDEKDWTEAAGYGWSHGDPFDRLIFAMTKNRNLLLITADEKLLSVDSAMALDAR